MTSSTLSARSSSIRRAQRQIENIYSRFIGKEIAYDDLLYQKKKLVMSILLGVEIRAAGQQFQMLARGDRYAREIPRLELNQVLIEVTAQLSVYRTYISNLDVADEDKRRIEHAIERARIESTATQFASIRFFCRCAPASKSAAPFARPTRSSAGFCHALAAIHRPDHGQGVRRHLPLRFQSADFIERSWRRSAPIDGACCGFSGLHQDAPKRLAARDECVHDA